MYITCRRGVTFQVLILGNYSSELKKEWQERLIGWGFKCEESEYNPELPMVVVEDTCKDKEAFYSKLIQAGVMEFPRPAMDLATFLVRWHYDGDMSMTKLHDFIASHLFDIVDALQGDGDAWARLIP